MQLEMKLELEIKIQDAELNINGIIKAIHEYQKELSLSILRELIEAIDRAACSRQMERCLNLYRHIGYHRGE